MNPVVLQPTRGAGGVTVSDWQTGVFDCCDDMGICLCGTFFPLCLSCQIASDMNECCLCGASVAMRTMYRTRYGIPMLGQIHIVVKENAGMKYCIYSVLSHLKS
eukprot:bmy_20967T0